MSNNDTMNFFKRRYDLIDSLLDAKISKVNAQNSAKTFYDYVTEIEYEVLSQLEIDEGRGIEDIGEYFKFMRLFTSKIKNAYDLFRKSKKNK